MKIKIKRGRFFFLIGFLLLGHENSIAQERWCQKYASEGFFKDKDVQKELQTFLTQDQIKKIESELTVQTPIQCKGDFLIVSGCKPHACPLENYMLFINVKEKQRYLCYWRSKNLEAGLEGEGYTLTFYGPSLPVSLNFKDEKMSAGCGFQDEAIDTFLQTVSAIRKKEDIEEAIKTLIKERRMLS